MALLMARSKGCPFALSLRAVACRADQCTAQPCSAERLYLRAMEAREAQSRGYVLPRYEIDLYRDGRFPAPPSVPCDSRVPFIHYPWYWTRFVNLFQVLVWCTVTLSFFILKVEMAEVDSHDDRNYFTYLTNWGWSYESLYAAMKLLALAMSGLREIRAYHGWVPGPDYMMRFVYEGMFLTRLSLNAGITFGVLMVLWDSPGLVTNYILVYGGSTVLTVNTLVHVIPLAQAIVDIFLNRLDLCHLYNRTFRGLMVLMAVNLIQPTLILFLYASHSSPGDVYNLSSWYVTAAVICIFILAMVFSVSLVILLHSPFTHVRILWPSSKAKKLDYDDPHGCEIYA